MQRPLAVILRSRRRRRIPEVPDLNKEGILRGVYREPLRSAQGDSNTSESAQNDSAIDFFSTLPKDSATRLGVGSFMRKQQEPTARKMCRGYRPFALLRAGFVEVEGKAKKGRKQGD